MNDQYIAFTDEVNACTRCALHSDSGFPPVLGKGSLNATYMIVASSPTETEARNSWFLSGNQKERLSEALIKNNVTMDDIYVTYAVKHYIPKSFTNGTWPPHIRQKCGLGVLQREIELVNPRKIFCFGFTATRVLRALSRADEHSLYFKYNEKEVFVFRDLEYTSDNSFNALSGDIHCAINTPKLFEIPF